MCEESDWNAEKSRKAYCALPPLAYDDASAALPVNSTHTSHILLSLHIRYDMICFVAPN